MESHQSARTVAARLLPRNTDSDAMSTSSCSGSLRLIRSRTKEEGRNGKLDMCASLHSFADDDNWRKPRTEKSSAQRGSDLQLRDMWEAPKPQLWSPLLPLDTHVLLNRDASSKTTSGPTARTEATTDQGDAAQVAALSMLNEALAALNLKGEAAVQAENLKLLISDAVAIRLAQSSKRSPLAHLHPSNAIAGTY